MRYCTTTTRHNFPTKAVRYSIEITTIEGLKIYRQSNVIAPVASTVEQEALYLEKNIRENIQYDEDVESIRLISVGDKRINKLIRRKEEVENG